MSCSAVAASALLWLAAAPAGAAPEAATPPPATALEPFFADIVGRAQSLKGRAEAMRKTQGAADAAFKTDLADLAELDMEAHQRLKARGTDGDLTCILRGIAEDLPVKMAALQMAADEAARDLALREMIYLLNDNIEVIVTPPSVTSDLAPGDI